MRQNLQFQGTISTSGGVNATDYPDLIADNQCAWAINKTHRGGKPKPRPGFNYITGLFDPTKVYSAGVFETNDSLPNEIVVITSNLHYCPMTKEPIDIPVDGNEYFPVKHSWNFNDAGLIDLDVGRPIKFIQCYSDLLIQNGLSRPVVYNGNGRYRYITSDNECPVFDHMAFDGSRLWGAKDNKIYAGDLAVLPGRKPSALSFTEINRMSGGGHFLIDGKCTGMGFLPSSDSTTGFGILIVFTETKTYAFRADIFDRTLWDSVPNFKTEVFANVGCISSESISVINTDMYWLSKDGLRSLRHSVLTNTDPGRIPVSYEVSRELTYKLPETTPAIYFNERLLIGATPSYTFNEERGKRNRTSFKSQLSLDFKSMNNADGLQSKPRWDGEWNGIDIINYFTNDNRCFVLGKDLRFSDHVGIYEIDEDKKYDEFNASSNKINHIPIIEPIVSSIEYKAYDWRVPIGKKKLIEASVWLSEIFGDVDIAIEVRIDDYPGWIKWHGDFISNATGTSNVTAGDSIKNIKKGYRFKVSTPSIPEIYQDEVNGNLLKDAHTAQLRISIVGSATIKQVMFTAIPYSNYKTYGDPSYGEITQ